MQTVSALEPLQALLQEASIHLQRRSFVTAQALLEQAARMAPKVRDVQMLQAILAVQTRQNEKAEHIFRALLRQNPSDIDALANLGFLLLQAERHHEAMALFERAIQLQPNHAGLYLNLGVALSSLGRQEDALKSYRHSLALNPNDAQTHFVTGKLLQEMEDFHGAFICYHRALSLNPAHPDALSNLLFAHHYLEDFSPHANSSLARELARAAYPALNTHAPKRSPKSLLKVGLVSADLREHPVGYFLETTLLHLDQSRLSLFAYSNNIFEDEVSARLKPHFKHWRVIEALNDQDAAALIRQDEIDILIDLSGYTAGHRQGLFALRPAPLQVTWLGYFSTTGQTAMDYVLADTVCVPAEEERFFVERVWRMPVTRYCFTAPASAPAVSELPALERGHITFGSFQALRKMNNRVLGAWAEILRRAPQSRLRIQSKLLDTPAARDKLQARLAACGAPLERVQLAGSQSRADYLASYREVDLLLDTFPYPGGTTTVEALWMGVPTLTLTRPGMLGRQGQSILSGVGLADWVVGTEADYIHRAVQWAHASSEQIHALSKLRSGLREQTRSSPLLDASQFARDFEQALEGMWQDSASSQNLEQQ